MEPFPPTASSIAARQMNDRGLTLLIAQHRMYDHAKAWSLLYDIGTAVVAIAAPATPPPASTNASHATGANVRHQRRLDAATDSGTS